MQSKSFKTIFKSICEFLVLGILFMPIKGSAQENSEILSAYDYAFERLGKSVYSIYLEPKLVQKGNEIYGHYYGGTGLILDAARGIVITNSHVVEGKEIVYLEGVEEQHNERTWARQGYVLANDPEKDLAIVIVVNQPPTDVMGISFLDREPIINEEVLSFNAHNLDQKGWVEGVGSVIQEISHSEIKIKTEKEIRTIKSLKFQIEGEGFGKGSSGGPLINRSGKLIGIHSAGRVRGYIKREEKETLENTDSDPDTEQADTTDEDSTATIDPKNIIARGQPLWAGEIKLYINKWKEYLDFSNYQSYLVRAKYLEGIGRKVAARYEYQRALLLMEAADAKASGILNSSDGNEDMSGSQLDIDKQMDQVRAKIQTLAFSKRDQQDLISITGKMAHDLLKDLVNRLYYRNSRPDAIKAMAKSLRIIEYVEEMAIVNPVIAEMLKDAKKQREALEKAKQDNPEVVEMIEDVGEPAFEEFMWRDAHSQAAIDRSDFYTPIVEGALSYEEDFLLQRLQQEELIELINVPEDVRVLTREERENMTTLYSSLARIERLHEGKTDKVASGVLVHRFPNILVTHIDLFDGVDGDINTVVTFAHPGTGEKKFHGVLMSKDPTRRLAAVMVWENPEGYQPIELADFEDEIHNNIPVYSIDASPKKVSEWIKYRGIVKNNFPGEINGVSRFNWPSKERETQILRLRGHMNQSRIGAPLINDQGELMGIASAPRQTHNRFEGFDVYISEISSFLSENFTYSSVEDYHTTAIGLYEEGYRFAARRHLELCVYILKIEISKDLAELELVSKEVELELAQKEEEKEVSESLIDESENNVQENTDDKSESDLVNPEVVAAEETFDLLAEEESEPLSKAQQKMAKLEEEINLKKELYELVRRQLRDVVDNLVETITRAEK